MNEADYKRMMEKGSRLSAEERFELEAYLATRPQLRAAWEAELGLDHLLAELPPAPVSSNFTSRVLQAVERETRPKASPPGRSGWRNISAWLRPLAMACVVVATGLALHQHQLQSRTQLVNSLKRMSQVPGVEVFKDFEAINRLSQTTRYVDVDLLAMPE